MDPEEFIRGLVSVGLVITMSIGANCQGAAGQERDAVGAALVPVTVSSARLAGHVPTSAPDVLATTGTSQHPRL